jgi:hypothetical protein
LRPSLESLPGQTRGLPVRELVQEVDKDLKALGEAVESLKREGTAVSEEAVLAVVFKGKAPRGKRAEKLRQLYKEHFTQGLDTDL